MISRRPGRWLGGVTALVLVVGVAGLMTSCGLVDTSHAELTPLRAGVVREICAGQTAHENPGDARLLARQSPEALQRASQDWGVDLGSWLAGRAAVGTSPACRDTHGRAAKLPVGPGQSRR